MIAFRSQTPRTPGRKYVLKRTSRGGKNEREIVTKAYHGHKALPNHEGEEHVHGHIDGGTSRAGLKGLNFPANRRKKGKLRLVFDCTVKG